MVKESERVVNSWKMKTGKNRKPELGQAAQGWTRSGGSTGKWKVASARRQDLQERRGLMGQLVVEKKNWLGKRARTGWKCPHKSIW